MNAPEDLPRILRGLGSDDEREREVAARALATELGRWFLRFFLGRNMGYPDAESLTVTSVTKTVLAAHRFQLQDGVSGFKAWAMCIARNVHADWYRDRIPAEPLDYFAHQLCAPLAGSETGEQADQVGLTALIDGALDELNPRDAELIRLRFLGAAYEFPEIAARLGISAVNARVATFRAVRRLGRQLRAEPRIRHWLRNTNTEQLDKT